MTGRKPAVPTDFEDGQIVERPDGFYWVPAGGGRERGPFPSIEEAIAEMQEPDEELESDDESVREAEEALGIPEWVDPDTGQLADDEHTRIEDH
jgi:hypothetical protein